MHPTPLPNYSFFLDLSLNMSSSGFPAKKTVLWLADIIWSTNKRLGFFGGKPLEFMFWLWSQKKLTLVGCIIKKDFNIGTLDAFL